MTVPHIILSKQQLFEYDTLTVNCEGFFNKVIKWRVLRNVSGQTTPCNTNSELFGPCHIPVAYPKDSGEYWCESRDPERRSESVYINITGSEDISLFLLAVLLQCPHRPVMKGTNVTLICTDKMAAPNHTALFFKDGETIGNNSSGKLTLKVSKSDEGVYKCRSSEGRESEEQWLAVRGEDGIQHNSLVRTIRFLFLPIDKTLM
uniref:Ig-like domain-containing protein n=1 Tax=Neogobius melanostomus TaxID=47308 RepID=A0A8C6TG83_9GOBI